MEKERIVFLIEKVKKKVFLKYFAILTLIFVIIPMVIVFIIGGVSEISSCEMIMALIFGMLFSVLTPFLFLFKANNLIKRFENNDKFVCLTGKIEMREIGREVRIKKFYIDVDNDKRFLFVDPLSIGNLTPGTDVDVIVFINNLDLELGNKKYERCDSIIISKKYFNYIKK